MFSVGNVFIGLRVNELLGKAKVDDVYCVLVWGAIAPHEEVFRLHVTVYQVLAVHILNSGYLRVVCGVCGVCVCSIHKLMIK